MKFSSVGPPLGAMLGFFGASLTTSSGAWAQTTLAPADAPLPMVARSGRDGEKTVALTEHGVGIVACSVDRYADVAQTTDGTTLDVPESASGIRVTFTNSADIVADSVEFIVSYAGEERRIVDRGHFSPGVTIDHRFTAFAGDRYLAETPDSCTIATVHFRESAAQT